MSVVEKKQECSKAKTAVTLASRRLISAVHRDVEYDVLKKINDGTRRFMMISG